MRAQPLDSLSTVTFVPLLSVPSFPPLVDADARTLRSVQFTYAVRVPAVAVAVGAAVGAAVGTPVGTGVGAAVALPV